MNSQQICNLSLRQACEAITEGSLSPLDLSRACLDRIAQLDRHYNSFIEVYRDDALKQAEALGREAQDGHIRGPLHGIPVALKDLIDVAGKATTAASAVFLGKVVQCDAEIVSRLKRSGAVILGKTNLHEFAYGGSGMLSHFGVVRNPANPLHIAGGSSSGSAAAVAARLCFAAIGTDTAGSIRLPAAFCGVVGLKPTYGCVSAEGVVPLSWSFDHVGPIARSVEDAAIVFEAISGTELAQVDAGTLTFGVARKYFFDGCDAETATVISHIAEKLSAKEVEIPVDEDRTVPNAEAFAYHLGFIKERPEAYGKETLRRISSGENISATNYILKRRELEKLRRQAFDLFRSVDVVITPTVPIPPPLIAKLEANPDLLRPRELLMLRNTRPFNVLGIPAISIPCGTTTDGLPIGIQLATAPGREDVLVAAGKLVEKI